MNEKKVPIDKGVPKAKTRKKVPAVVKPKLPTSTGKKVGKVKTKETAVKKVAVPNKKSEEKNDKKEKKVKRLCKWKKDRYAIKIDELRTIVAPARFICLKCGRAASDSSYLCKPQPVDE